MSALLLPHEDFEVRPFIKTARQEEACNVLNDSMHALLYGGSRSGKTFIIIRNIILRGVKKKSRHLAVRFRFNHAKTSLWYDTIPKVFELCFPGLEYEMNKSDWFIEFPTAGDSSKTSQLWIGGIDDKERVEKILGNEYSTIHINEGSQVSYEAVTTLRTRLAENSGLKLKMYYDLNPPGKRHWSYQEFIEKKIPGTLEKSTLNSGYLVMNPDDNRANLPEEYFQTLDSLPKRQRERYRDGRYLSEVEGALWTDDMVSAANTKTYGEIIKTVVAVDPSTTNNPGSDECGIVVCELDENREGVVEGDYSDKLSTKNWAQRAVNLYHEKRANAIVAEVNQGGDLVEDAINNIDPNVKVIKVHAAKGKFARAEPISQLYEQGKVAHKQPMLKLEGELTEWVPLDSNASPNRLDAMVWGMTELMIKTQPKIYIG